MNIPTHPVHRLLTTAENELAPGGLPAQPLLLPPARRFGALLAALRQARQLDAAALSAASGLPAETWRAVEHGELPLAETGALLPCLAAALGLPPRALYRALLRFLEA